ncbi:MAG: hypothetical protein AMXMBFR48_26920 [Ignavibacteriales bacterium]
MSDAAELKVYSVKVSYATDILKCISIKKMEFLSGPFSTFFFSKADSAIGVVQVDEAILGTGVATGSGGLFEMKFKARQQGSSPLNFTLLDLRNGSNQLVSFVPQNGNVTVQTATGLNDDAEGASSFIFRQNYPNPFNPATKIAFDLTQSGQVLLEVFTLMGEKVATLEKGELATGHHTYLFSGDGLPSGVYVCRLSAGSRSKSVKMNLLK